MTEFNGVGEFINQFCPMGKLEQSGQTDSSVG